MSLEGDLLLPPRGPARWGWAQKMMTAISRARGVLSPDESIVVNPSTGTLTLARPYEPSGEDPNYPDPFRVRSEGTANRYTVSAGTVYFNSGDPVTIPASVLSVFDESLIVIRAPLLLTGAGSALTPRHWGTLTWTTEVDLSDDVAFDSATLAEVDGFQYLLPGVRSSCDLLIPIAYVKPGSQLTQWWHGFFSLDVTLQHDHFVIRQLI